VGVSTVDKGEVATDASVQYLWDPKYIDSPILRWRNANTSNADLEEVLYYTTDANMNVTALVNDAGEVVERDVYAAYGTATVLEPDGSPKSGNASGVANEIGFCGYRKDPETGLWYVRMRYLQPTLAVWTTRDPTEYQDSMQMYQYVSGNPVVHLDPSGERTIEGSFREFYDFLRRQIKKIKTGKEWERTSNELDRLSNVLQAITSASFISTRQHEVEGKRNWPEVTRTLLRVLADPHTWNYQYLNRDVRNGAPLFDDRAPGDTDPRWWELEYVPDSDPYHIVVYIGHAGGVKEAFSGLSRLSRDVGSQNTPVPGVPGAYYDGRQSLTLFPTIAIACCGAADLVAQARNLNYTVFTGQLPQDAGLTPLSTKRLGQKEGTHDMIWEAARLLGEAYRRADELHKSSERPVRMDIVWGGHEWDDQTPEGFIPP
jgi:RHS repeat-associated protein